ncbi:MAG: alanine racemase [Gemmatimonadaceae bacterium]|nr:alanine racemase [Gemmatimonadaceae bacterium]
MATPPIYPGTTADPDPSTARDRAWLEVDEEALRYNAAALHARARVPLLPMVKANAYGLGAVATCRTLGVAFRDQPQAADQSPWGVGVATLDEAAQLRDAGCEGRILCSTPLRPEELARAASVGVRPALHRAEDIAFWSTMGGPGWHLAIDTGMARAGVRWTDVASLRDAVAAHPPEGVFTHFHSADESVASMDDQDGRFQAALSQLADVLPAGVIEHRDNSGAIASREAGSPGQLARPGIALYAGMFAEALGLRQVAHLRARIVDIRHVEAGESVSYGATWRASGLCRVATLAIGYADGYRRHLSNAGVVLIHGVRCPVVGRVTMDMTMVDVSHLPCAVGDVATVIGADGSDVLTTEWVADRGGVSPYELLVGLTMRVPMLRRPAIT